MRFIALAAVAAVSAIAAPASALTFNLGGAADTTQLSYVLTSDGHTATVAGYSWPDQTMSPSAFTAWAQGKTRAAVIGALTATPLGRDAFGMGVCSAGDANASDECWQIETNNRNEIISLAVSPSTYKLASAVFSKVDSDDTLNLFGVTADGIVERLGFSGKFDGPGNGTGFGAGGPTGGISGNSSTYNVTFNTGAYVEFLFATNNAANDGYRLNSVTLGAVPEPATWAMMLAGFGLVGAAVRTSRRSPVTATA